MYELVFLLKSLQPIFNLQKTHLDNFYITFLSTNL